MKLTGMCRARRGTRLQAQGTPPSATSQSSRGTLVPKYGPWSFRGSMLAAPAGCAVGDSGTAPSVPPQGCHPQKCHGLPTDVTGRRAARDGTSTSLSSQPSTAMSPGDGQEVAWGHLALAGCFGHMVAPTGTESGDTQPQAGSTACSGTDCAVKKSSKFTEFCLNSG